MIRMEDLSAEDKEKIMNEAREQINKEQNEKNIISMYNSKKKEAIDVCFYRICIQLNIPDTPMFINVRNSLRERLLWFVNYLYKVIKEDARKVGTTKASYIKNEEDWNTYLLCLHNAEACIISTYNHKPLIQGENNET